MSTAPLPEVTPLSEPYWTALAEGRLMHQRCVGCGNAWLPAREECPHCLAAAPRWVDSSGEGRVISWVVYHQAVHEYFADKVPYTVAVIELAEGPRLISSLVGDAPAIDAPVRFRPAEIDGFAVTSFELARD
ncbi:Zn-ribbon domain-containing OB-fold protein [Pseudonocardia halophobica]|uniref:Zn-ribbon domain-containing OB-fold protein n=1 Tax=Pseudonocardia halophobica TaxID=29401 RepID=UPI003D9495C1